MKLDTHKWTIYMEHRCHQHIFIVILHMVSESLAWQSIFGPWRWWWQPPLPPSAVLGLTLTLLPSGSPVHLLMGPSTLTVNHLDIRHHQGPGPLRCATAESPRNSVPRGGGAWFRLCHHLLTPVSSSCLTRHLNWILTVMAMLRGGCRHRQLGTGQVTENVWHAACFYKACINERLQLTGIECGMCGYKKSETTMCQHAVNLKTKLVRYSVRRRRKTMCDLSRISCSVQNSDLPWKYSLGSCSFFSF